MSFKPPLSQQLTRAYPTH